MLEGRPNDDSEDFHIFNCFVLVLQKIFQILYLKYPYNNLLIY